MHKTLIISGFLFVALVATFYIIHRMYVVPDMAQNNNTQQPAGGGDNSRTPTIVTGAGPSIGNSFVQQTRAGGGTGGKSTQFVVGGPGLKDLANSAKAASQILNNLNNS